MSGSTAIQTAVLALRSRDVVYSCPSCYGAVLRTSNETFEAGGVRCPRRDCRRPVKLVDHEVHGQTYRCKRCQHFLFESPTPFGRVWISCPNTTCRHNTVPQAVFLGHGPAPRIVGRARVVVGAAAEARQALRNGKVA